MLALKIDSSACINAAYALTEINRSALPVCVRQTLNQASLDVKLDVSDNDKNPFVHRHKTFFKASSHIDYAKGFDVNTMRSAIGFMPNPNKKTANDFSVQDLEQQENGGQIGGKAFIPTKAARRSGQYKKSVMERFRMSEIGNSILNSDDNTKGKTNAQKFILTAILANKMNKNSNVGNRFVIGTTKTGRKFLFNINSIKFGTPYKDNTIVNSTAIYSVKKGRHITPGSQGGSHHHFMLAASLEAAKKMEHNFNAFAKLKIEKEMEKYNNKVLGIK